MPTYEYDCSACHRRFEARQTMVARPLRKCPHCGKMTARRLIGAGSGLIFKGSGFYCTDYRKPEGGGDASARGSHKPEGGGDASARGSHKPGQAAPGPEKPAAPSAPSAAPSPAANKKGGGAASQKGS